MRGLPGAPFLVVMAVVASVILLLGYVPWSKPNTSWRPRSAEQISRAERHWDGETIVKGRDFRSGGYTRYFRRKGIVGLLLVAALAFGAHLALRRIPFGPGLAGTTLSILAVLLSLDVVALPFGLAGLAEARFYGISKQSVGFWLSDHYKGLAISLVISGIVAAVLLYLLHRFPRTWPVPATVLAGVGGVVMALIVPLVIDPIFNKFTPLDDVALKTRFLELARQGGVPAREVLISDASRRTTAVNAYFTGFGPTRRIVIYDTLVESLTPDEASLVVAHEVGHWSRGHIVKGVLLGVLGIGVALLFARFFLAVVFRNHWFGIQGALDPAVAPLLILLYWGGSFLSLPIENAISRRMETEADLFALDLTGNVEAHIATEVALGRKNLSDLLPPPFIEMLFFSHPSPLDRIALAENWARSHSPIPGGDNAP